VSHPDDPGAGGEELLPQSAGSRRGRLAYTVGAVVLVAGVLLGVLTRGHGGHPAAQSSAPPSTQPGTPASTALATRASAPAPRPSRTTVWATSLPDVGSVQLFARAANSVVRVDFGAGTVTTTAIPALRSTGPVSFGVTATGAYVRPLDVVPGYFVPDAGMTRQLTGPLAGAAVLPGPDRESVWVEKFSHGRLQDLREVYVPTSAVTSRSLPIPTAVGRLYAPLLADGSGGILVNGSKGTFDLRLGGAYRLPMSADDEVLAEGADRLLVADCRTARTADRSRCPTRLIQLPDGDTPATVATLPMPPQELIGPISPDRRTALIYQPAGPGQLAARLLDLKTGRFRGRAVPVDGDVQPDAAAYSTDSGWVFVVGAGGALVVVDARTGATQRLDADLPLLYQLAVRS
jgi:hypothetical protein